MGHSLSDKSENTKLLWCFGAGALAAILLGLIYSEPTSPYCMFEINFFIWTPWICFPGGLLLFLGGIVATAFFFVAKASFQLEDEKNNSCTEWAITLTIILIGVALIIVLFNQFLPMTSRRHPLIEFVAGLMGLTIVVPIIPLAVFVWWVLWFGAVFYILISLRRADAYWTTVHPLEHHVDGKLGSGSAAMDGSRVASNLASAPEDEAHGLGLRRRARKMKDEAERALHELQAEEQRLNASVKTSAELKREEAELSEKLREVERLKARIDELKKQMRD